MHRPAAPTLSMRQNSLAPAGLGRPSTCLRACAASARDSCGRAAARGGGCRAAGWEKEPPAGGSRGGEEPAGPGARRTPRPPRQAGEGSTRTHINSAPRTALRQLACSRIRLAEAPPPGAGACPAFSRLAATCLRRGWWVQGFTLRGAGQAQAAPSRRCGRIAGRAALKQQAHKCSPQQAALWRAHSWSIRARWCARTTSRALVGTKLRGLHRLLAVSEHRCSAAAAAAAATSRSAVASGSASQVGAP